MHPTNRPKTEKEPLELTKQHSKYSLSLALPYNWMKNPNSIFARFSPNVTTKHTSPSVQQNESKIKYVPVDAFKGVLLVYLKVMQSKWERLQKFLQFDCGQRERFQRYGKPSIGTRWRRVFLFQLMIEFLLCSTSLSLSLPPSVTSFPSPLLCWSTMAFVRGGNRKGELRIYTRRQENLEGSNLNFIKKEKIKKTPRMLIAVWNVMLSCIMINNCSRFIFSCFKGCYIYYSVFFFLIILEIEVN